jgi:hypothetical protein
MVNVYLPDEGLIDTHPTLADAANAQREDDRPLLLWVADEQGRHLACLMSDHCDREVCHTPYADGTSESYRLTPEGGVRGHPPCERLLPAGAGRGGGRLVHVESTWRMVEGVLRYGFVFEFMPVSGQEDTPDR